MMRRMKWRTTLLYNKLQKSKQPVSYFSPYLQNKFIIIKIDLFVNLFYLKFLKLFLGTMAHNVPAVYDVLAARIRALRSKDQGRQNVGGVSRGKEP
jgi:hypothetical protein